MEPVKKVLFEAYRAIEQAIYSEDGLDGDDGAKVLSLIIPHLRKKDWEQLKIEEAERNAGPLY